LLESRDAGGHVSFLDAALLLSSLGLTRLNRSLQRIHRPLVILLHSVLVTFDAGQLLPNGFDAEGAIELFATVAV